MVHVKSDGNGGSHVNLKPQWIAVCISSLLMLFSLGSFVFGYGVKSEKIQDLEKGRVENRSLIETNRIEVNSKIDELTKVQRDMLIKLGSIETLLKSHVKE